MTEPNPTKVTFQSRLIVDFHLPGMTLISYGGPGGEYQLRRKDREWYQVEVSDETALETVKRLREVAIEIERALGAR